VTKWPTPGLLPRAGLSFGRLKTLSPAPTQNIFSSQIQTTTSDMNSYSVSGYAFSDLWKWSKSFNIVRFGLEPTSLGQHKGINIFLNKITNFNFLKKEHNFLME